MIVIVISIVVVTPMGVVVVAVLLFLTADHDKTQQNQQTSEYSFHGSALHRSDSTPVLTADNYP
jgi:flagellar basal body-associated protein FliL